MKPAYRSHRGALRSFQVVARAALGRRLVELAALFEQRGWMLGTSGNLSALLPGDPPALLITASGMLKGRLRASDLLVVSSHGVPLEPTSHRPSAETSLHAAIYANTPARAVFHVHSPAATFASRRLDGIRLSDFEMMKGLGHDGPFGSIDVPILSNHREAPLIAEKLTASGLSGAPGLLIRDHGLYAWGRSLDETLRHVEIFEFLFQQIQMREH